VSASVCGNKWTELREEFAAAPFRSALRRACLQDALTEIRRAGQAPLLLRDEADAFLRNLTDTAERMEPLSSRTEGLAFISLQLADFRTRNIRIYTVHNLRPSYRSLPPVDLDSKDIQAEVLREGSPVIIVGNDRTRFRQRIFRQWEHEKMVRLWIPLFPFPRSAPHLEALVEELRDSLRWAEETGNGEFRCRRAAWRSNELRPPVESVFGTLEVAYWRRTDREMKGVPASSLEFDALCDDEVALSWAALAYARIENLYRRTLYGALERIGRACCNAVARPSGSTHLRCYLWRYRRDLRWVFPASGRWRFAPPPGRPESGGDPKKMPQIEFPSNGGQERERERERERELERCAREAAIESVHVAFRLHDSQIKRHSLTEREEPENRFGVLGRNGVASTICQEICLQTGATRATLFLYRKQRNSDGEEGWERQAEPGHWSDPKDDADRRKSEQEQRLAARVVEERKVLEEPVESPEGQMVGLPIRISDRSVAALLLLFATEREPEESTVRSIESRLPVYGRRLAARAGEQDRSFAQLMLKLRREINQTRQRILQEEGTAFADFVGETLRILRCELDATMVMLTAHYCSPSAPERSIRTWCFPAEGGGKAVLVEVPGRIGETLNAPCRIALKKKEVADLGAASAAAQRGARGAAAADRGDPRGVRDSRNPSERSAAATGMDPSDSAVAAPTTTHLRRVRHLHSPAARAAPELLSRQPNRLPWRTDRRVPGAGAAMGYRSGAEAHRGGVSGQAETVTASRKRRGDRRGSPLHLLRRSEALSSCTRRGALGGGGRPPGDLSASRH
jgi:hypothetical protein